MKLSKVILCGVIALSCVAVPAVGAQLFSSPVAAVQNESTVIEKTESVEDAGLNQTDSNAEKLHGTSETKIRTVDNPERVRKLLTDAIEKARAVIDRKDEFLEGGMNALIVRTQTSTDILNSGSDEDILTAARRLNSALLHVRRKPGALPEMDTNQYTVTFLGLNGKVLKEQTVVAGSDAEAPEDVSEEGYFFAGWDQTYHSISKDTQIQAQYEQADGAVIGADAVYAGPGDEVTLQVRLLQNPGINGMQLNVEFDDALQLTGAENGEALSSLTFTKPSSLSESSRFLWDGVSENEMGNGTLLILTFAVPENAQAGDQYEIRMNAPEGSIFDAALEDVEIAVRNTVICVR